MENRSFWHSTIKLYVIGMFYLILSAIYVMKRAPPILDDKLSILVISILGLLALVLWSKKLSSTIIGWFYITEVVLLLVSIGLNHQYYVENFEKFTPYLSIKLLVLFVALTAPSLQWVGWTVFASAAALPLMQYFTWPAAYRLELGIQEPVMTLSFIIVAGALYLNRLHMIELIKKETIFSQKIAILERLGNLVAGLQHLNNTPLQTIEISIQLLRAKNPDSNPILNILERSYYSVLRVNKLLGLCGSSYSRKSASTIQEFEHDIVEIGKYLKT